LRLEIAKGWRVQISVRGSTFKLLASDHVIVGKRGLKRVTLKLTSLGRRLLRRAGDRVSASVSVNLTRGGRSRNASVTIAMIRH
jgi:hypothetical protein